VKQSIRLGRVDGIAVGAHWSVAVILVIVAQVLAVSVLPAAYPHERTALYWTVAVLAAMLFLASLLVHELAHALVARRSGVTVRSVTLWMLGGVTEFEGEPPTAGADFRIAVAGPVASLAVGAIFYGVGAAVHFAGGPAMVVAAAVWLAVMNGILGVFNLLPGAPLDGGRILRAVLWRRYGDRERAERAAGRTGQVLGAVIIAFGIAEAFTYRSTGSFLDGLWLMLIGWFLIIAAAAETQASAARTALADVRVADVMTPHPELAPYWSSVADFIDQAARSRQDAFPVIGPGGELTGIVLASQLDRIAPRERGRLRLEQVALAVPPFYRAAPGDPAASLVSRTPLGGEVVAVVLDDDRVTGLVMVSDLQQALRRRRLTTTGAVTESSRSAFWSAPVLGLAPRPFGIWSVVSGRGSREGPWSGTGDQKALPARRAAALPGDMGRLTAPTLNMTICQY
jgi:Zn-dependent protease